MASLERTAYPRFRRLVSARELASLSPTDDEVAWARARARSGEPLLALVLSLRCFQRLGYFPRSDEVPAAVVEHVRRGLELPEGTALSRGSETAKWQRGLVRERVGVVHDPERARAVAAEAIRSAAAVKNNPPDLINVALEMLVKESLELPAFSTLAPIPAPAQKSAHGRSTCSSSTNSGPQRSYYTFWPYLGCTPVSHHARRPGPPARTAPKNQPNGRTLHLRRGRSHSRPFIRGKSLGSPARLGRRRGRAIARSARLVPWLRSGEES
jgi:hypothetical protein